MKPFGFATIFALAAFCFFMTACSEQKQTTEKASPEKAKVENLATTPEDIKKEAGDLAKTTMAYTEEQKKLYQEKLQEKMAQYNRELMELEAKLTTTKQEREEMLALLDLAKSKELTVKTMKSIDDIVGSGDADVARIGESIRARLDKASAKSEMMSSRLDDQIDEVLGKTELDMQLAERKKRLGMSS